LTIWLFSGISRFNSSTEDSLSAYRAMPYLRGKRLTVSTHRIHC
jgi:hypothetical protein